MKRMMLWLLGAAMAMGASAQHWNFGIEAGYLNSRMAVEKLSAEPNHGFMAGVTAGYTFPQNWVLESGLNYQRKGGTLSGDMALNGLRLLDIDKMDYLHLPVTAGYRIRLADDWTLTPKVGGYLAVGLQAKGKVAASDQFGQPFMGTSDFFKDSRLPVGYRPFNRCDGGLQFGLDLSFRKFRLGVGYQLGLAHIASVYDPQLYNRTFSLSLGYNIF